MFGQAARTQATTFQAGEYAAQGSGRNPPPHCPYHGIAVCGTPSPGSNYWRPLTLAEGMSGSLPDCKLSDRDTDTCREHVKGIGLRKISTGISMLLPGSLSWELPSSEWRRKVAYFSEQGERRSLADSRFDV